MKMKIKNYKKLTILVLFSLFSISILASTSMASKRISPSAVIPGDGYWISDPELNNPAVWDFTNSSENNVQDLDGVVSGGKGDIITIGNQYVFNEVSGAPLSGDWTKIPNPNFPVYPDYSGITVDGCRIQHIWDENVNQTRNTPSALWTRDIHMPVDMSDYEITSASISATFSADVEASPINGLGGGIETSKDPVSQYASGDSARVFVLLSDIGGIKQFEIAFNKTKYLGQDNSPTIETYIDEAMSSVPENILIAYLTSVLEYNYYDFKIILGIELYCEDNHSSFDVDTWNYVIITECDLTFTYQKKVDKGSTLSLSYTGNSITGENTTITGAELTFEYQIDQNWTDDSEFSELRVFINNNKFGDSIRLSHYNVDQGVASVDMDLFEYGSIIPKDVDIILTIQLYIANTFTLDSNITLSVDKIQLHIFWKTIQADTIPGLERLLKEPWFATLLAILVTIGLVSLAGGFIYYYRVGRFPIPVRKVRKYRRSLTKESPPKDIRIIPRDQAFKDKFADNTKIIHKDMKDRSLGKKIKQSVLLGEYNKFLEGSSGNISAGTVATGAGAVTAIEGKQSQGNINVGQKDTTKLQEVKDVSKVTKRESTKKPKELEKKEK